MAQTKTHVCPQCGKTLNGDLPGRPCPHCLMGLAMENGSNSPTNPRHGARPADIHVPPIEKLVAEFPNFEIQHLIGHGGMGAVYQARQINLDRIVALKILSPRLSFDPAFAERFLREARLLAKLAHPNIVTVFDFGKAGEFYFLTMEFVDGVNLRDTILAKLLAPSEALAIIPQVCDALQYAHDKGVVHRDIKPENILITKDGKIKIADFGLAKLLQPHPDQFTLTGTRQVMGTMNYMAPEQIESPDRVDHRADLYSLGVVFYELLTGELPLGRFSLPSEKSNAVSGGLDDVVMRTLEKDPDRRYQQASFIKTACMALDQPKPCDMQHGEPQQVATAIPICRPFPVTSEDFYGGFAAGYGLMRGYDTHLELDFEIRDALVSHKWGTAKVNIPLEKIAWIRMHKGWVYTYIEVQAEHVDVVSEIPNSIHGKFRVYLDKVYRETAQMLVQRVVHIIENTLDPGRALPMPPVKASHSTSGYGNSSIVNWPGAIFLFLFIGFCVAIGLTIILGAIWLTSRVQPEATPAPQVEVTANEEASTQTAIQAEKAKADEQAEKAEADEGGDDKRDKEPMLETEDESKPADVPTTAADAIDQSRKR